MKKVTLQNQKKILFQKLGHWQTIYRLWFIRCGQARCNGGKREEKKLLKTFLV
jgi:hypothetical protein